MNPAIDVGDGGVFLRVHVQPRASRSEVAGLHGDALKVRLRAPPVDGAANEELIRFLADALGLRRDAVTLVSGATSRAKRLFVRATVEQVSELLGAPT
ncbi:MAG TPA: DUF167 domain-containing protein [Gemmatimonadales bacterium]|nr:DUF167 domain-containing protein [Gemmatimonadales bacterium]